MAEVAFTSSSEGSRTHSVERSRPDAVRGGPLADRHTPYDGRRPPVLRDAFAAAVRTQRVAAAVGFASGSSTSRRARAPTGGRSSSTSDPLGPYARTIAACDSNDVSRRGVIGTPPTPSGSAVPHPAD